MPIRRMGTLKQVAQFASEVSQSTPEEHVAFRRASLTKVSLSSSDTLSGWDSMETGRARLSRLMSNQDAMDPSLRLLMKSSVHSSGLPRPVHSQVLMQVALEEEWQLISCTSLPFTLGLVSLFMAFFSLYHPVSDIWEAEAQLRQQLSTTAHSVSTKNQMYDWMQNQYIPYMWNARHDGQSGNKLLHPKGGLRNTLLAGIELTAMHAAGKPCEDSLARHLWCFSSPATHTRQLAGSRYDHGTNQSSFKSRSRSLRNARNEMLRGPQTWTFPFLPVQASESHVTKHTLPAALGLNEILDAVRAAQNGTTRLIQETTLTLTLRALLQNSNFKSHNFLIFVNIVFFFNRGGNVYAKASIATLLPDNNLSFNKLSTVLGLLWCSCMMLFSAILAFRLISKWKAGTLMRHWKRGWTAFEWVAVVWGWSIVIMVIAEHGAISKLQKALIDYQEEQKTLTNSHEKKGYDIQKVPEFAHLAEEAALISSWIEEVAALFHIVLVGRFFIAIRGQPRLALILNAVTRASVELIHLLLVIFAMFTGYAITGHLLFGDRIASFATPLGAFAACFEILMEKEFDWDQFVGKDPFDMFTSTLWVYSFLVTMVLFLVNVFIAMLISSYEEVRSTQAAQNLLTTSLYTFTRAKARLQKPESGRPAVSSEDMIQAIQDINSDMVFKWMLQDCLDGLDPHYADHLFDVAEVRQNALLNSRAKHMMPEVLGSTFLATEAARKSMETFVTKRRDDGEFDQRDEKTKCPPVLCLPISEEVSDQSKTAQKRTPIESPQFVKVQLKPHLQKQAKLLENLHVQIDQLSNILGQRGVRDIADVVSSQEPHSTPLTAQSSGEMHDVAGGGKLEFERGPSDLLPPLSSVCLPSLLHSVNTSQSCRPPATPCSDPMQEANEKAMDGGDAVDTECKFATLLTKQARKATSKSKAGKFA